VTDAFRKNKIVFVPGKNPKPSPDVHRDLLFRCMIHGIQRVDADAAKQIESHPDCFQLESWNEIFYRETKSSDEDEPWIRKMCAKRGPDERDRADARSWRLKTARLLYLVADHLQFLIPLLPDPAVKSAVRETERYFKNRDGIADSVRELVKAPLREMLARGERILLIGHSMGAIIAYDALWQLNRNENFPGRVDLFLSLGSPLGMHYVQRQLLGYHMDGQQFPANMRRWVNIAAQGDLTALVPAMRDHFRPMIRLGLIDSIEDIYQDVFSYFRNEKGLNAHRSYGYLVEAHVARTIAQWWRGRPETDRG